MSIVELSSLLCIISVLATTTDAAMFQKKKIPYLPAGTYMTGPDMFIGGDPADVNVPICKSTEPCGYYTYDNLSKRPLKWIPSWCQCESSQKCIYSGINKRQRTYVHSCAYQTETEGTLIVY